MKQFRDNFKYELYETSGWHVISFYYLDSPSIEEQNLFEKIRRDSFKFDGRYVAKVLHFPTKEIREKFLTFMYLKYGK